MKNKLHIWVDADACPVAIKEILYKAAQRTKIKLTLVANRSLRTPASPFITTIRVASGQDVADHEIVDKMESGDLVITQDIPLAASVIEKNGHALSPRGELFTLENIGSRLSVRDFLDDLRKSGVDTGGPAPLNKRDHSTFASQLDKFLTRNAKRA